MNINRIIIVSGYRAELFNYKNVKYYHIAEYKNTNMVESLMCASSELNDDVIITKKVIVS